MKPKSIFVMLIAGLLCPLSMSLGKDLLAQTLPPPVEKEFPAGGIMVEQFELAGKIIKVTFNRIYNVSRQKNGMYEGNLRSSVTPAGNYSDFAGMQIRFSQEGLGYLFNFFPKPGTSDEESADRIFIPDSGVVYIQVGKDPRAGFVAIGDQYQKEGDEKGYRWSVKTEIPELAVKRAVSVSDVFLFPDQLVGKTVELQFYRAGQITQTAIDKYNISVWSGRGDTPVQIKFSEAGKAFFKEIAARHVEWDGSPDKHRVFVTVELSPNGTVLLIAQGRRIIESDDGTEYRW
jgi:hypothetical protein